MLLLFDALHLNPSTLNPFSVAKEVYYVYRHIHVSDPDRHGRLIAFLGDRIGSKVGKKRMTLFGLRPKYTSVIVTIISGILISFFTIAVLAVVNENVRVALFGLSKLQNEMQDLNQEIKVRTASSRRASCSSKHATKSMKT